jgi:hypothetical protein
MACCCHLHILHILHNSLLNVPGRELGWRGGGPLRRKSPNFTRLTFPHTNPTVYKTLISHSTIYLSLYLSSEHPSLTRR